MSKKLSEPVLINDSIETAAHKLEKDNIKFINLQFTDLLGLVKSLTIPVNHFSDAVINGVWFDGSSIEGFSRIAESDMFLKPDLTTYAVIPWLNSDNGNTCRFICDVYKPDGTEFEGNPRYVLKKVIADAKEMGFVYNTGPELEFFLFKKDNGIKPLPNDTGSYFDMTTDEAYEVRRDMTIALQKFGILVESSHHEVAIGQHEISFQYADALKTADNAVTFKFTLKAIAQKHGLHATFMPKPITGINGSGMHVHQSLFDAKTGKNAFYDENNNYKLSKTAYSFIAGQLTHAKAMTAVLNPLVNSYKRLVPGYEAPVYISWATINRSALIRIPRFAEGKTQAARAELRCPDPSCNVYLAFAVMLKAGLDGIKNEMIPPAPIEENIYNLSKTRHSELNIETLPHSLWQALDELNKNEVIKETLGKHTSAHYIAAKTKEWDKFRLQVTQWEIDNYLGIY